MDRFRTKRLHEKQTALRGVSKNQMMKTWWVTVRSDDRKGVS